jgi:hypothetical protein
MKPTLVISVALAAALVAGIVIMVSRNKSAGGSVAPTAGTSTSAKSAALDSPGSPLADATAHPAEAKPTRTTAAPTVAQSTAASSVSAPTAPAAGAISNSADEVGDPNAEAFARKYEVRSEVERRAALTDIRNVLWGEDQIPADVKEGRLDPAVKDQLKAEIAWLEAHPKP